MKNVSNFVVVIKTNKREEPIGFFVPLTRWQNTNRREIKDSLGIKRKAVEI